MQSQINDAFSTLPIPLGKLSIATYDDENTHAYFTGTKWNEHDVLKLREQHSSISFFTPEAFKYYLPAFMVAELNHPELADIIAETLANKFIHISVSELLDIEFSQDQLAVIKAFFEYCEKLYDDEYFDEFSKAVNKIELVINGS